jgi:hypothetical protein
VGRSAEPAFADAKTFLGLTMTRYTNVGWKRTFYQASFDPNDDQSASNTASTSMLGPPNDTAAPSHTIDTPAESDRKRRRKSKANSEDSIPATISSDGDKTSLSITKSERTKVLAAKPELKANLKKARRAKSALFFSSQCRSYRR